MPHPRFPSARTKGIPSFCAQTFNERCEGWTGSCFGGRLPLCPLEKSEVGEQKLDPRSWAESTAGLHAAVSPASSPPKGLSAALS